MSEEELEQLTKIDPKVIQTMLLFKTYKELKKLRILEEQKRAEGVVEPFPNPIIITEQGKVLRPPGGKPWISMDMVNDGPDSCWALVNIGKSIDAHEILNGETYGVDMKTPLIEDIYLYCKRGETASLRIVGVR